jgi:hypothetical protein
MPKVKNPLFSQEARGGIGGLVYNTWRGQNYVKTNTSPTGQGTAKRLAAQAIITTVSKLWQGLSDAQRAAWSQYAIDHPVTDWTGSPKRLTGMNWYMSCNSQLTRITASLIDDPPSAAGPDPVVDWAITDTTGDLTATWTSPTAPGDILDVSLVGPISAGVQAKIEKSLFLVFAAPSASQPLTLVSSAAVGRYTAFVKVIQGASGLVSTVVSSYADIS